ncbi:MAG: glycosyl transferase, group 1 [Ornithinibacter sp.]|jgi:glycosyltransferase involved in cell wall biosynthesis|nr:glycosyl transferase, group 1 [Ornithinibacter sp.]
MTRVALVVDSPSKRAHGNAASRLALGLVESGGAQVDLVCYSADPPPPWLPSEVRIHRLGVDRVSRSVPALVRYLRAARPDVLITRQVHANFVGLAAAWIARTPPRWRGKLVLVQDHLPELTHASNRRDNKWAAKAVYRFADGLIAPSPTVLANTIEWCGLDPASGALVPNPIPKQMAPLGPPPHPWLRDGEPPVFVNVTNLLPFKRVDLLIDAFSRVRATHDVRLLILGEGPGRLPADEQIRRLGLGDVAATVGWIDDPLQYVARSWALVHPSDEDGFAQVLTEAMSVGCPVIACDSQGGGPRFVTDAGTYGLLVPRGDVDGLAEAMTTMLDDEARARYSALGEQRADAMSPVASATALTDFLARRWGLAG